MSEERGGKRCEKKREKRKKERKKEKKKKVFSLLQTCQERREREKSMADNKGKSSKIRRKAY